MALSQKQRWAMIGGALAVTLGLVFLSGEEADEETVEPAKRSNPEARAPAEPGGETAAPSVPAAPAAAVPGGPPPALRAGRVNAEAPGEVRDIFAKQTWHVPPPPPPPGPPQAPPLPFEYVGKLIDDGRVTVYLEDEQERSLAVRQGDVIDGLYRVKRITATAVVFVYIPMNKQQILEIGSAN